MNILLILTLLVAIGATYGAELSVASNQLWQQFKQEFQLSPYSSAEEEALRASNFLADFEEVKRHNSDPSKTFVRATNFFSVMTAEEKKAYLGLKLGASNRMEDDNNVLTADPRQALPATFTYVGNKCLVAVKNQGACGSCWAFATTTPVEFAKCKASGVVVNLSEQQLVDCDTNNKGCNGGFYSRSWDHIMNVTGIARTATYPYRAVAGPCRFNAARNRTSIGAQVLAWSKVAPNNTAAMKTVLVRYGPIAVGVAAVNSMFSYKTGVYNDVACDKVPLNHAVVVVGYGTLNGVQYWLVRNSWGATWGDKGYIKIQQGVNKCGIESWPYAAFVV